MGFNNMKTPFERSYWVVLDKFLAGYFPGDTNKDIMFYNLDGLLSVGISTVINIMESDELDLWGDRFDQYESHLISMAESKGLPMECIRMPIRDMSIPTIAITTSNSTSVKPGRKSLIFRRQPGPIWNMAIEATCPVQEVLSSEGVLSDVLSQGLRITRQPPNRLVVYCKLKHVGRQRMLRRPDELRTLLGGLR